MGSPVPLSLAPGERPVASEPWVTPDQLAGNQFDPDVDLNIACLVASQVLNSLSGNKFGVRQDKVRPVRRAEFCFPNRYDAPFAAPRRSNIINLKGPVRLIDEVKVWGKTLDHTQYSVYGRKLLRGGGNMWPVDQDLGLRDDQPNTMSITYQYGMNVPAAGQEMARQFAIEIAKYMGNDKTCKLPDRILSITRQGVSFTKVDPTQFIVQARTGLYMIDQWLASVSSGQRMKSTVNSIDEIRLWSEDIEAVEAGAFLAQGIATYIGETLPANPTNSYVWYKPRTDGTLDVFVEHGTQPVEPPG